MEFANVGDIATTIFSRMVIQGINPQADQNNPEPCECGKPVTLCETKSELIGHFKVYPKECEECKKKAYNLFLLQRESENYELARSKCDGNQNRKVKTKDHYPHWKDMDDKAFSQKQVTQYMVDVLDGNAASAFIYGPTGTGKSYLMKVLTNELVELKRSVCFIRAVDLALSLRKRGGGIDLTELINDLKSVETLIIDDFGTQKNTEFIREVIFSIFDYRYEQSKRTIVTSNLVLDDIEDEDKRLASRMRDSYWMKQILLKSDDMRIKF